MPELTGMMPFADYVKGSGWRIAVHGLLRQELSRKRIRQQEYDGVSDVSLLIGPEGDFSDK